MFRKSEKCDTCQERGFAKALWVKAITRCQDVDSCLKRTYAS